MSVATARSAGRMSCSISLVTWGMMVLFCPVADGQIIPDNTLGAESSVLVPEGAIERVVGGATRGSALFHSFSTFGIEAGQQVYFANPSGIDNILGRVTGLMPSQIDGLLGVSGPANLFLLNPNGIVFGPGAQLDVQGSFVASTSDRFRFADGTEFRATPANAAPLVTVNIPLGLQLGPDATAPILSEANLDAGQDLTLSAGTVTSVGLLSAPHGTVYVEGVTGNVQVQDVEARSAVLSAKETLILVESRLLTAGDLSLLADQSVYIRDSEAVPFLAAAGGNLLIQGHTEIDILTLNHPQTPFQSGGNLTLASDGPISGDAHFFTWGSFSVEDLAGNPGSYFSYYDPIISAEGDVTFGDYTGVALKVEAVGSIEVNGDIAITGPDTGLADDPADPDVAILQNSAALILRAGVAFDEILDAQNLVPPNGVFVDNASETTFSSLDGGIVDPATGAQLIGSILITESTLTTEAGPIILSAGESIFLQGSTVDTIAPSSVDNTGISLTAADSIELNGSTLTTATLDGLGGEISLDASAIDVEDTALLTEATQGTAGNITVPDGVDTLTLNDSTLATVTVDGLGGEISLTPNTLTLANGTLSTSAVSGSGGGMDLRAFTATVADTVILTEAVQGTAGNIAFNVNNIALDNSTLTTSTANGQSGNITVSGSIGDDAIPEETTLATEGTTLATEATGMGGIAGEIFVRGKNVFLSNSELTSSTVDGAAGDITVRAIASVAIADSALLTTTAQAGAAGTILIANIQNSQITGELMDLTVDNSLLSVASQGGTTGDIDISTSERISLQNSPFLVTGEEGAAGGVNITTSNLEVVNGTIQSASGASGSAVGISITADQVSLDGGELATATGAAGNDSSAQITLVLDDEANLESTLFLSNESLIIAEAQGEANGGNIEIFADFIIAESPTGPAGSDIIAIAEASGGGTIDLKSTATFGITASPELTENNDIFGILLGSDSDLEPDPEPDPPDPDPLPEPSPEVIATVGAGVGSQDTSNSEEASEEIDDLETFLIQESGAAPEVSLSRCAEDSIILLGGRGGLPTSPTAPLRAAQSSYHLDWVDLSETTSAPPAVPALEHLQAMVSRGPGAGPQINDYQSPCRDRP